jgi:hypothetical protein
LTYAAQVNHPVERFGGAEQLAADLDQLQVAALGLPVPFTLTFHIEQKFAAGTNPDQVLTAIHQDLEKLLKQSSELKDGETEKTK